MMKGINALLEKRLRKKEASSKMNALAKKSNDGQLSSFAGVFSVSELSVAERNTLEEILLAHTDNNRSVHADLEALIQITSEVKAINNQAALLHGERIKRAHALLTTYTEGAFTAWLVEAYGNRQTPYNFWQYYEFYSLVPKEKHEQLEAMPRQAVYTLATRKGALDQKLDFISKYSGETKREVLDSIRTAFPLGDEDKRGSRPVDRVFRLIAELQKQLSSSRRYTTKDKEKVRNQLHSLLEGIHD